MAGSEPAPSGLPVVDKAQTEGSVEAQHVALCDAHDLIAVLGTGTTSETAVTVYRLKGDIAFTVALRDDEDLRPLSLQWKPDGSLLAVTWSDEVCCLYSGENGKLLYELSTKRADAGGEARWSLDVNAHDMPINEPDVEETAAEGTAQSAPIIWTSYDDTWKGHGRARVNGEDLTTDDFFDEMTASHVNGDKSSVHKSGSEIAGLVNSLTTLDATAVLPRLSRIETSTGMRYSPEGNKFSTQASTDTIFDASSFAPGVFSTLLASDASGCMTVFVDETIKVGHMQLSSSTQIKSVSSTGCTSQVVLSKDAESGTHRLNFIDLPLDRLGSPLNFVISLNTRRLQSLTAYITHTIRCIHQEIQTGIKGVPSRLMKLLEEDLRSASGEPSNKNAATNLATIELQHLALTSNFDPVILEWLKDIVKETGHKRWDQATNAMYEHIQSYLFKNLLPALQRFVAAASALRGQAAFHQLTGRFAVSLDVFDTLIQWADALSLVAQRALQAVTEEHVQFKAFSKWLRVMIDVAVAGPGTKGADETEEREAANYDVDLCLRYMNGPLMDSLLKVFVEAVPLATGGSKEEFFGHPAVRVMSRANTVGALEKLDGETGSETRYLEQRTKDHTGPHDSDPVNLPLLTCLLKAHTRLAIEEINAWQSQAVPSTPETLPLPGVHDDVEIWDLRISPAADGEEIVHILASAASSDDTDDATDEGAGGLQLISVKRRPTQRRGNHDTASSPADVQMHRLSLPPPRPESAAGQTTPKVLHAAFAPPPPPPSTARPTTTTTHPAILLLLTRTSHPSSSSSSITTTTLYFHTTTTSTSSLPPPTAWRHLHTWPSPSPSTTCEQPPSYLPSPSHFLAGGRPGRRIAVVFSPPAAAGAGTRGRGGATRWEALDLEEGVFTIITTGGDGEVEGSAGAGAQDGEDGEDEEGGGMDVVE